MFRYPSSAAWVTSAALVFLGVCTTVSSALAQAPIIDGGQSSGAYSSPGGYSAPAAATSGGASGPAEMYRQLQSLQEEVMQLRGLVEEQGYQLQQLKQQSLERYMDLDRRLGGGVAAPVPAAGAAPLATGIQPVNASEQPQAPAVEAAAATPAVAAVASPSEQEAYKQAYAKLKGQQNTAAIQSFNAFLKDYPASELVPNAYYWLGSAHYANSPQNLSAAEAAYSKLLSDFPQHSKAPDALYGLGKVAFAKGDKAKSKKLMQRVIDEYGASGSSAPQLAKQFIDQNLRK